MGKVIVKATGSFMYTTDGDCRIRISDSEAISLRGLAEAIENIQRLLSTIYPDLLIVAIDRNQAKREK